jgi:hypothetical protein
MLDELLLTAVHDLIDEVSRIVIGELSEGVEFITDDSIQDLSINIAGSLKLALIAGMRWLGWRSTQARPWQLPGSSPRGSL